MRTRLAALLLPLTFCLALVVYAQTNSTWNASQEKGKSMKLTGCLQNGSEPNTYILDNVSMAQSRTSEAPSEMARTEPSYKLIPEGDIDLKDHIGHKVEVTGMLMNEEREGNESSSSGSSSSSYSQTSGTPELKVSAIRHLATTCP